MKNFRVFVIFSAENCGKFEHIFVSSYLAPYREGISDAIRKDAPKEVRLEHLVKGKVKKGNASFLKLFSEDRG